MTTPSLTVAPIVLAFSLAELPLWLVILSVLCLTTALITVCWFLTPATKAYGYNSRSDTDTFKDDVRRLSHVRPSQFCRDELPNVVWDVIVVGSGSGGCACANHLAHAGYSKVLVLEQHPTTTGGCTHSFTQDGCEWDTG